MFLMSKLKNILQRTIVSIIYYKNLWLIKYPIYIFPHYIKNFLQLIAFPEPSPPPVLPTYPAHPPPLALIWRHGETSQRLSQACPSMSVVHLLESPYFWLHPPLQQVLSDTRTGHPPTCIEKLQQRLPGRTVHPPTCIKKLLQWIPPSVFPYLCTPTHLPMRGA